MGESSNPRFHGENLKEEDEIREREKGFGFRLKMAKSRIKTAPNTSKSRDYNRCRNLAQFHKSARADCESARAVGSSKHPKIFPEIQPDARL